MRILALADDVDSLLTQIRLREPLDLLCQRQGWRWQVQALRTCRRVQLLSHDVLLVQRGVCRRTAALMRHMRRLGGGRGLRD